MGQGGIVVTLRRGTIVIDAAVKATTKPQHARSTKHLCIYMCVYVLIRDLAKTHFCNSEVYEESDSSPRLQAEQQGMQRRRTTSTNSRGADHEAGRTQRRMLKF